MGRRKGEKLFFCADVDLPRLKRVMDCKDPRAAVGLWVAMTAYAREELTDGVVPKRMALGFYTDPTNAEMLADMVKNGLIAETDDGYVVLRYAPRNQTKAMVEEAREKARKRMQLKRSSETKHVRANKRGTPQEHPPDVPPSPSPSGSQGSTESQEEIGGPPTPDTGVRRRAQNATDDGALGLAVSAWLDGVREVTGKPCSVGQGPTRALVDALVDHCPDLAERVPFARAKAVEWAKHCIAAGKLLNPHAFVDWLNTPKTASGVVRAAPRALGVAPGKQAPADFVEVAPEHFDSPTAAKGR